MIETMGKKGQLYMKTLVIFLALIIFSTVNAYSEEPVDCKSLKKNSPKYLICKTKSAGSAIRTKLTKKVKLSNRIGEESFIKRFGKAKSLSDLK
jgi:hypothetical protein|tara:strand:- start:215 stop:496 length:282 start_codon:yes stop_codon:yes gene_type:complete